MGKKNPPVIFVTYTYDNKLRLTMGCVQKCYPKLLVPRVWMFALCIYLQCLGEVGSFKGGSFLSVCSMLRWRSDLILDGRRADL